MADPAPAEPRVRELSRRGLLGPEEGWSLAPVGAWIMIEGRHIGDPRELLEALAARLDAAGAGIERLGFTVRTIHPQIAAWGCYWSRRGGSGIFTGRHGTQNSDAYIGSPVQFVYENGRPYRRRLEALDEQRDPALMHELRAEGMTDYYALPLWLGSGELNFMTTATARPGGFSDEDLERIGALSNLLAPLVETIHARRMTLGLLDAFIGPRISERILQGQVKRGDGDRIDAAFWYSDLRGFTALSESLPAPQLLALLNEYFENCAAAAAARGGEILQFIGDAILIVFEIRRPEDEARVCEDALDAAIDAFDQLAVVNHRRRHAGLPEIAFGLGLHLGTVTHANVGAPDRLAFNVVGPAVNKTARLQSMTKLAGVPLLLSKEFASRIGRPLRSMGHFDLKGIGGPQEMFTPEKEL
ncbi:MAG TPA: adenylate/guanylate cyclase domain-containing protein [Burkholderiales bacterium]|nr:adenylate/guanylate cyclase domain-containing protein [Burkholderiales bacterium]